MSGSALCNSLRNGFRSARPLIPAVERGWWGACIRPLPPYVTRNGGRRGRIQSPQEAVVKGSADGRGGARTQETKETNESEAEGTATSTATAKRNGRGSSADRAEKERDGGKAEKQREEETNGHDGGVR